MMFDPKIQSFQPVARVIGSYNRERDIGIKLEANECYSFEEHLSLPPDVESSKITLVLSYIFLHLCHVVLINVSRENKFDTKVREVCLTTLIAKIIYFLSETNYHEKY